MNKTEETDNKSKKRTFKILLVIMLVQMFLSVIYGILASFQIFPIPFYPTYISLAFVILEIVLLIKFIPKFEKKESHKKVGRLPVNSRITIDYSQEKPSVKFEYPKKNADEQVGDNLVTMLCSIVLTVFTLMLIGLAITHIPNFYSGYPTSCIYSIFENNIDNVSYVGGFNMDCIIDNTQRNMNISYSRGSLFGIVQPMWQSSNSASTGPGPIFFNVLFVYGFGILLFFGYKKLLTYIFQKTAFGNRMFPELGKKLHDQRFSCTFKPEDVKDNRFELPLFRNIYMDYEMKGEMADYLIKVEIIEHPFSIFVDKKGSLFNPKNWKIFGSKKVKDKNVYLWKAVFTFSQQPLNGKGEVRWT